MAATRARSASSPADKRACSATSCRSPPTSARALTTAGVEVAVARGGLGAVPAAAGEDRPRLVTPIVPIDEVERARPRRRSRRCSAAGEAAELETAGTIGDASPTVTFSCCPEAVPGLGTCGVPGSSAFGILTVVVVDLYRVSYFGACYDGTYSVIRGFGRAGGYRALKLVTLTSKLVGPNGPRRGDQFYPGLQGCVRPKHLLRSVNAHYATGARHAG